MERGGRRGVALIAALAALMALPAPASAVLSGFNGRIVIASGRGETNDNTARLYLRTILSGVGAGSVGPTITPSPPAPAGVQHRHPTWSPDRTMIAYARGDNNCNPATTTNCGIFTLDLTDPNATPQNITGVDNVADDRPAWSPDGTRIAYETELTNVSGQTDILVDQAPFGSPDINLTNTPGTPETKPAWSPDSQTLYYTSGAPGGTPPGQDANIVKEPADNSGTATLAVPDSDLSEFQPSISPDGTQICFTLGQGFDGTADVFTAPLANPASQTNLSDNVGTMPQHGDYNCTWSPDGTMIAYVQGTFALGDLVMERSDDTSLSPIFLETTTDRFDGNPDWAPDGRPECQNATATTDFDTPVTIPLSCADTGPQYERTSIIVDVPADANPTNGTVGEVQQGDPATVTYTPNAGFTGTDSFQIRVRDFAFGGRADVTVNVRSARSISFDVNKNKVRKGKKVTFSGDVDASGNVGACEPNQPVELQRKKPAEASFTAFAQLQTDAAGSFSLKQKIKKTFEWRAVLGENQACEDATSNTEKVKAKKKKKKK